MSVRSSKYSWSSLLPRIDREVTRRTPCTLVTASSIGLAIVNTISREPSAEPSATIVMRGKRSSG